MLFMHWYHGFYPLQIVQRIQAIHSDLQETHFLTLSALNSGDKSRLALKWQNKKAKREEHLKKLHKAIEQDRLVQWELRRLQFYIRNYNFRTLFQSKWLWFMLHEKKWRRYSHSLKTPQINSYHESVWDEWNLLTDNKNQAKQHITSNLHKIQTWNSWKLFGKQCSFCLLPQHHLSLVTKGMKTKSGTGTWSICWFRGNGRDLWSSRTSIIHCVSSQKAKCYWFL